MIKKSCLYRVVPLSFALLAATGCGPSYKVGEVDGKLIINGKPGKQVRIQFMPDSSRGTRGPISVADTADDGHFVLELMQRDGEGVKTQPGALIGVHRIVLTDLALAASPTGKGVPIRFEPKFSMVSSTPLLQEVKPGKQTIELKVP